MTADFKPFPGESGCEVIRLPPPERTQMFRLMADADVILNVTLSEWKLEFGSDTVQAGAVTFKVKNTGSRGGDEVAQIYVKDLLASVARPVMQLEGFSRVHLEPGETREITTVIGRDQLQFLDRDMHWIVEPGTFRVMIGASSKDIRLRGELVVQ